MKATPGLKPPPNLPEPEPTTTVAPTTPCKAATVAVGAGYSGGLTAGQFAVFVQLTPRRTCSLYRMVGVAVIEPDGQVVTDASSYTRDWNAASGQSSIRAPLTPPLTVPVGDTLGVMGQWSNVCSPDARPPFRIRVTFADGTTKVAVPPGPFVQGGEGPPRCLNNEGSELPDGGLSLGGASFARVVTGAGTDFQAPKALTTRMWDAQTDCHSLIHTGWKGQCGEIDSPTARAVWVTESRDPSVYLGTSAQVWRLSSDGKTATLVLRRDDPQSTLKAAKVDLGDGDLKVVFVTRLVGTRHLANVDMVEPDGVVVVHRDLSDGAVRVESSGLDTWGRDIDQSPDAPFVNEQVQYNNLASHWTVLPGYVSDPTQVPSDAL